MGFFARFSPTGRYIAATVGETSLFVMLDDLYFTQLFYPATGRIACYDRKTNRFFTLNGADSPEFVQTGPEWSPDGRYLLFSRARVDAGLVAAVHAGAFKKELPSQTIDRLNAKYPFKFDLYRVPFNDGRGGEPEPLKGAADNGMSNYFPRYSPDGRWVVFTQSPTGHALQPESRLCIVPAEGGEARVLESNTPLMNSWHSWSPNGRWLVFASKGQSPFTELYLTKISPEGTASPPVRLFRLSSPITAAMVPEFISAPFSKIDSIRLNDRQWALGADSTAIGR
jgi:dipeptidyl aminopeptidase/acylaminoacyl peptidase